MNYLSMSYQKIRHNFQALAFSCALGAVSYTHLDVYKRQAWHQPFCWHRV